MPALPVSTTIQIWTGWPLPDNIWQQNQNCCLLFSKSFPLSICRNLFNDKNCSRSRCLFHIRNSLLKLTHVCEGSFIKLLPARMIIHKIGSITLQRSIYNVCKKLTLTLTYDFRNDNTFILKKRRHYLLANKNERWRALTTTIPWFFTVTLVTRCGLSVIRHDLIWGTKTTIAVLHQLFKNESQ